MRSNATEPSVPILRPDTLSEALDILARPMLVQVTAGGPPPRMHPHALLMDAGRVTEMAGIHRMGGEVIVGVNNAWSRLMRSPLLRPGATCLADAANLLEEELPGGVLLHALDATAPDNPIILALAALDARVELALRGQQGRIQRRTLPLQQAMQSPPEQPHLMLSVRFSLPYQAAGSAFYRESNLSPMQPDALAAAALVILDSDSGQITSARLTLGIPGNWPIPCSSIQALTGREPKKEAIEAVIRLALRNCPQPRASTPEFSLALSPHLIRETLDRAIARALASV